MNHDLEKWRKAAEAAENGVFAGIYSEGGDIGISEMLKTRIAELPPPSIAQIFGYHFQPVPFTIDPETLP